MTKSPPYRQAIAQGYQTTHKTNLKHPSGITVTCVNCNDVGSYFYDGKNSKRCENCCKHIKGYTLLQGRQYGDDEGKHLCNEGCGTVITKCPPKAVKGYSSAASKVKKPPLNPSYKYGKSLSQSPVRSIVIGNVRKGNPKNKKIHVPLDTIGQKLQELRDKKTRYEHGLKKLQEQVRSQEDKINKTRSQIEELEGPSSKGSE